MRCGQLPDIPPLERLVFLYDSTSRAAIPQRKNAGSGVSTIGFCVSTRMIENGHEAIRAFPRALTGRATEAASFPWALSSALDSGTARQSLTLSSRAAGCARSGCPGVTIVVMPPVVSDGWQADSSLR